jgi:sensor histidine kinase YesM
MKTITLNEYSGTLLESREDEIGILQDSFNHMIERNKELIAQQYQTKIEKRNAQLRALQAQINPHFMYNTLQVIGGMALDKDAPEIYTITLALSDILRYSLNFSKEMIQLTEEIKYLQSYDMIQNERFGGKVHLVLDLAPETRQCLIPKLILQPLAENSFEHGLLNKDGDWVISVASEITDSGDLQILVKDNGVGIAQKDLDKIFDKFIRLENHLTSRAQGNGLGLYITKNLVESLSGTIHVNSELNKGTEFILKFPLYNQEEVLKCSLQS